MLMVAAVAAALLSLRRGVTVASAGAALFALTYLVAPFNDVWGRRATASPCWPCCSSWGSIVGTAHGSGFASLRLR